MMSVKRWYDDFEKLKIQLIFLVAIALNAKELRDDDERDDETYA